MELPDEEEDLDPINLEDTEDQPNSENEQDTLVRRRRIERIEGHAGRGVRSLERALPQISVGPSWSTWGMAMFSIIIIGGIVIAIWAFASFAPIPTNSPTKSPTFAPTTKTPSLSPSLSPTQNPTKPTETPTTKPTASPTPPTLQPTKAPSTNPTISPSTSPTSNPTQSPTDSCNECEFCRP